MTWQQQDLALPMARSSDPITSHQAAFKSVHFKGGHCERILDALQTHGPLAACQMDIIGLTVVQADRRLPELAKSGLILMLMTDDGAEVTRNGCRVWRLA